MLLERCLIEHACLCQSNTLSRIHVCHLTRLQSKICVPVERKPGEWHASVDEHGLSPLNYVLPPIKPTCNCVGTVDWELIQSLSAAIDPLSPRSDGNYQTFHRTFNSLGESYSGLMSFLWLQFDPHRIQHQAMQALSAPINAFSCIIAVMNTQLSWIDMPNDGGSLEAG